MTRTVAFVALVAPALIGCSGAVELPNSDPKAPCEARPELARHFGTLRGTFVLLEQTTDYRLSGKTGWAGLGDAGMPQVGWLVGYVERANDVYFYATNIDIVDPADAKVRLTITKAALEQLGVLRRE